MSVHSCFFWMSISFSFIIVCSSGCCDQKKDRALPRTPVVFQEADTSGLTAYPLANSAFSTNASPPSEYWFVIHPGGQEYRDESQVISGSIVEADFGSPPYAIRLIIPETGFQADGGHLPLIDVKEGDEVVEYRAKIRTQEGVIVKLGIDFKSSTASDSQVDVVTPPDDWTYSDPNGTTYRLNATWIFKSDNGRSTPFVCPPGAYYLAPWFQVSSGPKGGWAEFDDFEIFIRRKQ